MYIYMDKGGNKDFLYNSTRMCNYTLTVWYVPADDRILM